MKKDKKEMILIVWVIANVYWWVLSIALSLKYNLDVNPYLNNLGEIILNAIILGIGIWIISRIEVYDSSDDEGFVEVESDESE